MSNKYAFFSQSSSSLTDRNSQLICGVALQSVRNESPQRTESTSTHKTSPIGERGHSVQFSSAQGRHIFFLSSPYGLNDGEVEIQGRLLQLQLQLQLQNRFGVREGQREGDVGEREKEFFFSQPGRRCRDWNLFPRVLKISYMHCI